MTIDRRRLVVLGAAGAAWPNWQPGEDRERVVSVPSIASEISSNSGVER